MAEHFFNIKVRPNSPKTEVKMGDGTENDFVLSICAVPENGKANNEVIRQLSKMLGVPKESIEIIRGKTTHKKLVRIKTEQQKDELIRKLDTL